MALTDKQAEGGAEGWLTRLQESRITPWVAALGWMGLIFVVSNQSRMPDWAPSFEFRDVWGHWIAYGVLALLLRWALASSGVRHAGPWAFVVAVLYGLSDEFHQGFVPGRHPDPLDLLVDAAGAALALIVFALARRRR